MSEQLTALEQCDVFLAMDPAKQRLTLTGLYVAGALTEAMALGLIGASRGPATAEGMNDYAVLKARGFEPYEHDARRFLALMNVPPDSIDGVLTIVMNMSAVSAWVSDTDEWPDVL